MENFAQWFPNVRSVVSADTQPHATLGKQYVEVEPDRLFVTEGDFPPLLPRMEIEFQPQGASCTVTWRMFSRNTSLLARFTWLRLARRIISERATVGVAQLKRQLERR